MHRDLLVFFSRTNYTVAQLVPTKVHVGTSCTITIYLVTVSQIHEYGEEWKRHKNVRLQVEALNTWNKSNKQGKTMAEKLTGGGNKR